MSSFKSSDGIRLAYRDEGTGPAILCLSGLTRNASDFDYAMPHLSGARVIRMDYRGRGASDWADHTTYTIPRETQDGLELLDHLGLDQVAILGTSRGGLIAMAMAAMAKDRLKGVCLNDIGPEIAREGLEVIKGYIGLAPNPAFASFDAAASARAAQMPHFSNVPMERWREEVMRHYVETPDGLAINYDPKLRYAVLEAAAHPAPDLWPLFDALDGLPLALIRGANSDLLTRKTAAEMRHRRPDMRYGEVPDRGHIPFLDEAEAVAVLKAFIEDIR